MFGGHGGVRGNKNRGVNCTEGVAGNKNVVRVGVRVRVSRKAFDVGDIAESNIDSGEDGNRGDATGKRDSG